VKIVLPSGATLETTASFCRLDNDEVVVTFDPPLPTTFVFEEQCRLLALQRSIGLAQTRL
jgi:hypothetical protein